MDAAAELKKAAGIAACDVVKNGMKVGLGTGSTVAYTVIEIGRRISEEGLQIIGVPTSRNARTAPDQALASRAGSSWTWA